jgi:hypothetical protein
MLGKVLRRQRIETATEDAAAAGYLSRPKESLSLEKVRAMAIGAALAASVDTSPAVLLNIEAYAERHRDKPRRTA